MKFRNDIIIEFIKKKNVLDLGFLGEDRKLRFSPLHEIIVKYSKNSLGVDFHYERIKILKSKGYNVICDDVIKLEKVKALKKKYSVIVCGEIIEHIDNIGKFFQNLKDLLDDNGIIIVTTPNIFSLRYILRHFFLGQETPYWKDRSSEIKFGHVVGFSNMLLHNLFFRHNFKIIKYDYTIKNEYKGFKGNIEKIISLLIPRLAPSLIYIIKKK